MMPYVCVALGGAIGSVARFAFGAIAARWWGEAFPWGTLAINVLGSFVIGFYATLTVPGGVYDASANMRAFVLVGLCGGFTTFSSFSLQTLILARNGDWMGAIGNVGLSVGACLVAVTMGLVAAMRMS